MYLRQEIFAAHLNGCCYSQVDFCTTYNSGGWKIAKVTGTLLQCLFHTNIVWMLVLTKASSVEPRMLMFCLQHWYNKSTLWELLILQAKKARPVVLNLGKISSYKGVNLLNH